MKYRLMIIEDEEGIASAIKNQAEMWGMDVLPTADFRDIMKDFASFDPHIVLMDISLPFYNGYYWCEEIRRVSKVPIIFISSAGDNMNIVMAMSMGADDFIAKPFDMSVLMAKIQAMLRRTYDFTVSSSVIEHRGVILNTANSTVIYNGNKTELTKNEYRILLTLLENREKTVSREKLMEALWKTESFVDENTLSVNVNRLRKKLESIGAPDFIVTKFGVGYIVE